jgi:hypothetical protein
MWLSPLAQQFKDDDDNVDDDVIEMGQDTEPESEPAPKKPRTRRKPTQQKDSSDS